MGLFTSTKMKWKLDGTQKVLEKLTNSNLLNVRDILDFDEVSKQNIKDFEVYRQHAKLFCVTYLYFFAGYLLLGVLFLGLYYFLIQILNFSLEMTLSLMIAAFLFFVASSLLLSLFSLLKLRNAKMASLLYCRLAIAINFGTIGAPLMLNGIVGYGTLLPYLITYYLLCKRASLEMIYYVLPVLIILITLPIYLFTLVPLIQFFPIIVLIILFGVILFFGIMQAYALKYIFLYISKEYNNEPILASVLFFNGFIVYTYIATIIGFIINAFFRHNTTE